MCKPASRHGDRFKQFKIKQETNIRLYISQLCHQHKAKHEISNTFLFHHHSSDGNTHWKKTGVFYNIGSHIFQSHLDIMQIKVEMNSPLDALLHYVQTVQFEANSNTTVSILINPVNNVKYPSIYG